MSTLIGFVAVVNFQVSILKILASYPGRLARHGDLKRELALLATSGKDWADFSRRLAAGFPNLDIFSLGFIERYSFGWRLTQRGAVALETMEAHARSRLTDKVAPAELPPNAMPAELAVLDEAIGSVSPRFGAFVVASPGPSPAERRSRFTLIDGGRA